MGKEQGGEVYKGQVVEEGGRGGRGRDVPVLLIISSSFICTIGLNQAKNPLLMGGGGGS